MGSGERMNMLTKNDKNKKFEDMRILQQVKVQNKWILYHPSTYQMNFTWKSLKEMVDKVEGSKKSLIDIHAHYTPKEDYYAPYVRFALECQLENATRIEWYSSSESLLDLLIPVPKSIVEQQALLSHFLYGEKHEKIGELKETVRIDIERLQSQKRNVVKYWT